MDGSLLNTCRANTFAADSRNTLKHSAAISHPTDLRRYESIVHALTTGNFQAHGSTITWPYLLNFSTNVSHTSHNCLLRRHIKISSTTLRLHHQNTFLSHYSVHWFLQASPPWMPRPESHVLLVVQRTQHTFPICIPPTEGHRMFRRVRRIRIPHPLGPVLCLHSTSILQKESIPSEIQEPAPVWQFCRLCFSHHAQSLPSCTPLKALLISVQTAAPSGTECHASWYLNRPYTATSSLSCRSWRALRTPRSSHDDFVARCT